MASWKPEGEINPYAPPASFDPAPFSGQDGDDPEILADRGTRLGAVMLDGLIMTVAMLPAVILFSFYVWSTRIGARSGAGEGIFIMVLAMVIFGAPLVIYQWYLTATRGQTLGKKWLGIKIVKVDGSRLDFVSGVVLRSWVVGALGYIPYIGGIITLADCLMIFGDDRRCLHDKIAGTKVIVAPPRG